MSESPYFIQSTAITSTTLTHIVSIVATSKCLSTPGVIATSDYETKKKYGERLRAEASLDSSRRYFNAVSCKKSPQVHNEFPGTPI